MVYCLDYRSPTRPEFRSGRSAARLARLLREQEVGSSNLPAPTNSASSSRGPAAPRRVLFAFPAAGAGRLPGAFLGLSLLLAAVFLTGFASPAWAASRSDAVYTVRKGDSLSRIAARTGVGISDLRKANSLRGDIIHPGQKLKVPRPLRRFDRSDNRWRRPHNRSGARILREFGARRNSLGVQVPHTGVDIALPLGTTVVAPATGVVRYVGEQDGYGLLLIIEHAAGRASVLGPFDRDSLKVALDDVALRGDPLGRTGDPVEGDEPYLHMEVRIDGKAIRPTVLLR